MRNSIFGRYPGFGDIMDNIAGAGNGDQCSTARIISSAGREPGSYSLNEAQANSMLAN